jgi:hypothetical protein
MTKKSVKKNVTEILAIINPWQQAIYDAEQLIERHKKKIQKLRGAIVGFRDMRDQEVPWPGTTKSPDQSESPITRGAKGLHG